MWSAMLAFCSTSSTVTPCSRLIRTMISKISFTSLGARPSDGSSSSIILGRAISARLIASICCSPPDSAPARWSARALRTGKYSWTISRSRATPSASVRVYAPMRRFSRTDRNGNTSLPSGTWLKPSLTTWSGSIRWISRPLKTTVPFCGSMTPDTVLRIVVLPAPLAPRMVTMFPAGTAKLTPRMARIGPYAVSTFETVRRVSATPSPSEIGLDHFRMLLHLARRAERQRAPVVQCQDLVGHGAHQAHVVLDHQHGDAEQLGDVLDPERHLLRLLHAQSGGRLVEQEQLRLRAEGAPHLDDLPDAVRQVDDEAVPVREQIDEVDDLLDGLPVLHLHRPDARQAQQFLDETRAPVRVAAEQEILENRRVLEQLDVLERARDPAPRDLVRWH